MACCAHNGKSNSLNALAKPLVSAHGIGRAWLVCWEQKAVARTWRQLAAAGFLPPAQLHVLFPSSAGGVEFGGGAEPLQNRKPVSVKVIGILEGCPCCGSPWFFWTSLHCDVAKLEFCALEVDQEVFFCRVDRDFKGSV